MIYLTGQLLLFLLLSALLGFAIGWIARGAFAIVMRIPHGPGSFLAELPFSRPFSTLPDEEADSGDRLR